MSAETGAAIAALIVAILAMTVAMAQAVQQYLVTGQLIRMCDSVVYGKMPGQGHRVWEFSQFRFRVIYSVPQVSLRSSLWSYNLSYQQAYPKGHLPLPDLRHPAREEKRNFGQALGGRTAFRPRHSAYSAVPGEAPWVSFCRVVQHTSENDLLYEMVEGDADRVPADLSVVPMQVSMRDIVITALMAGMRCTDASFEKKSLCIEGPAGTISSSLHPILGAIIRFAPRNVTQPQGLRIGEGSVNPQWMARMWDVVIIAGRSYSLRERRYYEIYEGYDWVALSQDRTVTTASPQKSFSTSSSRSTGIRSRRASGMSTKSTESGRTSGYTIPFLAIAQAEDELAATDTEYIIRPSRHDGAWYFESEDVTFPETKTDTNGSTGTFQPAAPQQERKWYHRITKHIQGRLNARQPSMPNSQAEMYRLDVEGGINGKTGLPETSLPTTPMFGSGVPSQQAEATPSSKLPKSKRPWFGPRQSGMKMLDGDALQEYITEKKVEPSDRRQNGRLLLTWPEADTETKDDSINRNVDDWERSYLEMNRERSRSYAERWRTAVRSRSRQQISRDYSDDWEIVSQNPRSRQSSTGHDRTLYTPKSNRSTSRGSRKSRMSIRSTNTDGTIESRGRPRTRKSRITDGAPFKPRHATMSRERSRKKPSIQSQSNVSVAYGNSPIMGSQDANDSSDRIQNPIVGKKQSKEQVRKQKPVVGFKLDKDRESAISNLSPKDDTFNRQTSNDGDSIMSLLMDSGVSLTSAESHNRSRSPRSASPKQEIKSKRAASKDQDFGSSKDSDTEFTEGRRSAASPSERKLEESADQLSEEARQPRLGIPPLPRKEVPEAAPWTKINRSLVSPAALEACGERFLERPDYVVVFRVLTREEIEDYSILTEQIRDSRYRHELSKMRLGHEDDTSSHEYPLVDTPNHISTSLDSPVDTRHESSSNLHEERKPKAQDWDPSTAWSYESNISSATGLQLSESPSRISESEQEDKVPKSTTRIHGRQHRETHVGSNDSRSSLLESGYATAKTSRTTSPVPRRSLSMSSQDSRSLDEDWAIIDVSGTDDTTRSSRRYSPEGGSTYSEGNLDLSNNDSLHTDTLHGKGEMNWLWICQTDVIPGYFATPWQGLFSESVCLGAIKTMLEVLPHFTGQVRYVESLPQYEDWVRQGRSTHPSYAINAMGGIIVSGKYSRVPFDSLRTRIPPIQLLRSYDYQVNQPASMYGTASSVRERLGELMALDSWLAFCGRLPEICDGGNNLLRRMPALIQKIMHDFDYAFRTLDRTATEGGFQIIKEMAMIVLGELDRQHLSDAEQLFTTMAMLRSAKMALYVIQGPSTVKLRDILLNDVQVHLV